MSYSSSNYATALWLPAGGSTLYICRKNVGVWGQWAPVALAEQPQEYTLSGTDESITYSLDQFGRVYVDIRISETSISDNKIIGTLPIGFRPSRQVTVLARVGGIFATLDITSTGNIRIFNASGATSTGAIFASASFLAA